MIVHLFVALLVASVEGECPRGYKVGTKGRAIDSTIVFSAYLSFSGEFQ